MLLVRAVREVEAGDVHAGVDERLEALERVAGGAQGAHELGASKSGHGRKAGVLLDTPACRSRVTPRGASTARRASVSSRSIREAGTPTYVYDLDGDRRRRARARRGLRGGAAPRRLRREGQQRRRRRARARGAGCGADVVSGAELCVALGVRHRARPHRLQRRRQERRGARPRHRVRRARHRRGPDRERRGDRARRGAGARRGAAGARRHARQPQRRPGGRDARAHRDGARRGEVRRPARRRGARGGAGVEGVAEPASSSGWRRTSARSSRRSRRTSSAARVLFDLVRGCETAGACPSLAFVDTGGGFGVDYGDGLPPSPRRTSCGRVRAEQRCAASAIWRSTSSRGGRWSRRTACCSRASSRRRSRRRRAG